MRGWRKPAAGGAPGTSTISPKTDARLVGLQIVFVVSGFCGLIYESIWSHYLKLFVGHAAYAQTVVLIVFIGGMAIGAWVAGRVSARIAAPLFAYALIEGVIGAVSLGFHAMFVAATDWAYATLLPAACIPESPCVAQWVLAAGMILPQSVLLGTTFPLMTAGILRLARSDPGQRIASFYFLNSIGAVFGVLASGFVLIPAFGLPGTLLTAGLLNFAVAIAAYLLAKGAPQSLATSNEAREATGESPGFGTLLLVIAALTGLSSFIYEIVWIRMLSLVVGASTHAFELMLAAFILGLALGGAWVRRRVDRFRDLVSTLAVVQILMGIAAVATVALYDQTFEFLSWLLSSISRSEGGYLMYNLASHLIAMAVMLPATFLAGMTLPLITVALLRTRTGESAIGYVYAANTFGAIGGVVIAVHFALPVLGLKYGLILGATIDVALGIALFSSRFGAPARAAAIAWSLAGAASLAAIAAFAEISWTRTASGVFRSGVARVSPDSELVYNVDGKTSTVSVVRTPEVLSIRTNGKPDASVALRGKPAPDEYTMALSGLLPLAHHARIETAAVIGFGSGITTATLLGSPNIRRVDTIEIEPRMVEGARAFGSHSEAAYTDPRSRIIIDDAKSYFARSRHKYDLIMSEPSNPWVSGVASLFTVEFYRHAKRQLSDGGLFVQWLQIYEFSDELLATILRALDQAFPDYIVYGANAGDMIIVASSRPLAPPSGSFLEWPNLRPRLSRLELESLDELEARRIASAAVIRPLIARLGGNVNSDFFPIVDQSAPRARFLRSNADGLTRLVLLPVPVIEMLERRDPAATPEKLARNDLTGGRRALFMPALAGVAWFERAVVDDNRLPTGQAALLRATLWDCAPWPNRHGIATELVELSDAINPQLSPPAARRLWSEFREAKCANRLSDRDRQWLELVDAVGARDAARMASLGSALATSTIDDKAQPAYYALLAAATGLLVQERRSEAQQLLGQLVPKLPPGPAAHPVWRLLEGLAAEPAGSRNRKA